MVAAQSEVLFTFPRTERRKLRKISHYDLFLSEELGLKVPEYKEGMQTIRLRRSKKKKRAHVFDRFGTCNVLGTVLCLT
jgi:hypothetical protein